MGSYPFAKRRSGEGTRLDGIARRGQRPNEIDLPELSAAVARAFVTGLPGSPPFSFSMRSGWGAQNVAYIRLNSIPSENKKGYS
jgi:hypothetical protein